MEYFYAAIISYLLGSVSFAVIFSKLLYKKDVRTLGSKNAGTTNMLRCFGPKAALPVLLLDGGKTAAAVLICGSLFPDNEIMPYFAGLFAMLGHIYPVFFGFRGGKGVASAAGIILATDPLVFLMVIIPWAAIVLILRYVSVASMTAAVLYPVCTWLLHYVRGDVVAMNVILSAISGGLIIFAHRSNIKRLLSGSESKIF